MGRWYFLNNTKANFIEELYHTYAKRIADWAYRHLGDYEQAKDIVHDTFLIAMIKIDDIMASDNPKRWLYKTARNLIGHAIRERNKKQVPLTETMLSNSTYEIDLGMSEFFPQTFSMTDRRIVLMFYLERRSIREIADTYGISISACKMRLLRLRRELKNIL